MTSTHPFEERLLAELRQVVAARPAPTSTPAAASTAPRPAQRRVRGRLAMSAGALAAATAAVAITATSGDRTPSAYAVEKQDDGTVSVQINSLKDADGLERKLRAAGIPAIVSYTPADDLPACPKGVASPGTANAPEAGTNEATEGAGAGGAPSPLQSGAAPKDGKAPKGISSMSLDDDGHATFTLTPRDVGPGEHLLITTSDGTVSSVGMQVTRASTAAGPGKGAGVPACVPDAPKK